MSLREQLQATLGTAYTLERQLTGGGMSHVFVAEETALRRKVVVKVLPQEVAASVNADRFKREIMVAARLQHPHIVPVLTTGETNGVPYYTMPFVEGESIRAILARSGIALSITEVIGVLRDVAKALAYAHDHGIVHRDIKPDNVLMSGGSATVTDFGIAKAIAASRTDPGGEHQQPTLTQIGTSIGTPAYMAPEQAAGDPATDHRSDIYSFGCMAYELLAGRPPFVEKSPRRLMGAHMADIPTNVKSLRPDTPDALAQLVMRCLEKEPNDRPQRAGEIVSVLEGVTSGGSHSAMPATLLGGQGMLKKALVAYTLAFIAVAVIARLAITAIGLPDWVFPGALLIMALGLPVILFTAYVHHTTRVEATVTPTYTPGGTSRRSSGTIATLALKASPHVSWRRTWMGGAYAVGAFVLLVAGWMTLRALGIGPAGSLFASGRLIQNEPILVADFNSADTTLSPVVTHAFRTAIGQSRSMSVVEPTELQAVLRRMQRPANTKIDFAVAREIASREGIKAIIIGEVVTLGGKYLISARLVSAQTGTELARIRQTADNENEMLPAIDELAKDFRARIGESLRDVQATPTLERVTTPSLEALRKYVQGSRIMSEGGDFTKGVGLLEEAVALDTAFAMAYRRLASEYSNRGFNDKAMTLLAKAYQHRDRLSDAERYLVLGSYYYRGPQQDLAKTISAYETLIEMQPENYTALNNVAIAYRWQRNSAKAEEVLRRSIATPNAPAVSYNQLIWTLWEQGRKDEAWQLLARYDSVFPNTVQRLERRSELLYAERKYDSSIVVDELMLRRARDPLARAAALGGIQGAMRTQGRLAEADRHLREIGQLTRQARPQEVIQNAAERAMTEAVIKRNPQAAVRIMDAALAEAPIQSIPFAVRPRNVVVVTYAMAGRPDRIAALQSVIDQGRGDIVRYQDERDRLLRSGATAFAQQRYDDAARDLRAASDIGDCHVCGLPMLAQAYDRAGSRDSAISTYRRYLDTPDRMRYFPDVIYLAPSLQRLGELYEAKGDIANAVKYYREFIDVWKRADPELQPRVAEVRRRISRLSDIETSRR